MKRKTLTLILCLLTVMSLVGVGFASWVISAGDSESVGGNIVVDTVADQRLELTVLTSSQNIVFAGTTEDYNESEEAWLTLGGSATTEALSVTYNCSLKYKGSGLILTDALTASGTVKANVKLSATFVAPTENTAYDAAKNICFVEPAAASISNYVLSEDNQTLTFDVTITYTWGSAFGGVNPFEFYNETQTDGENVTLKRPVDGKCGAVVDTTLTDTSTWGDHAVYYLGLLEAIDATTSYSITINAEVDTTTGTQVTVQAAQQG